MSCASSTLKFSLLVLNFLCFIFGVFIFASCTFSLIEFKESEVIRIPCISEMVLSSILVLNGIFGCCSTSRRSTHFIWMYAVVMLLLLMGQITVIFYAPINFGDIHEETINKLWTLDGQNQFKMSMYEIEHKCCGRSGPNDYAEVGEPIPLSCYPKLNASGYQYRSGCLSKPSDQNSINQAIEDLSNWVLVALEATSGLVAVILAITLRNIRRRSLYH